MKYNTSDRGRLELKIMNSEVLDKWMNERREKGHDICSIKGEPPKGSGEELPINVAWKDAVTGEVVAIEYEVIPRITKTEEALWSLLDDISTAFDMFHPEMQGFEKYVSSKCEEREQYLQSFDGHTLTRTQD